MEFVSSPISAPKSHSKLSSKYNHLAKIPSTLHYVPKKINNEIKPVLTELQSPLTTSSPSSSFDFTNLSLTSSSSLPLHSPDTVLTSSGSHRQSTPSSPVQSSSSSSLRSSTDDITLPSPIEATKISKPKKNLNSKKKKASPQQTSSPTGPKVGAKRVPLSTIYDSNSNQTKAEYRPVLKNITNRPTSAGDKVLNKNKASPTEKKKSVFKPKPFSPPSRLYSQSTPASSVLPPSPPQTPLSTPVSAPAESSASAPAPAPVLAPESPASTPAPAPELALDPAQTQSPEARPLSTSSLLRTSSNRIPRKLPTRVYQKKDLYAFRNLPICSVPHPGRSPSQIMEEYNLQYADEQEKEYLKLLEDDQNLQLLFKSPQSNDPNLFTESPSTFMSTPITPVQNNGSNCNSPNTPQNNDNNNIYLTPTKNRNKKAWIPKNLAADLVNSSGDEETRNIDCQNSTPYKISADYKINSTQQISPKNLAKKLAQNSSKPARNQSYNSPKHNYKVILSTNYEEPEQGETSDEELNCGEYFEPYFAIQEIGAKRLESRQKQIDIGKNTPGYKNYTRLVKKEQRTYSEPQTPDKYQICSKRSWDGQIRVWRRMLHHYDPISPRSSSVPLVST